MRRLIWIVAIILAAVSAQAAEVYYQNDFESKCDVLYWAAAAGQLGMACDLRELNVTPDQAGKITIRVRAVGENDAILQGIEIE